jgi:hypothetical protein
MWAAALATTHSASPNGAKATPAWFAQYEKIAAESIEKYWIEHTIPFRVSLDETLDIGGDTGTANTPQHFHQEESHHDSAPPALLPADHLTVRARCTRG